MNRRRMGRVVCWGLLGWLLPIVVDGQSPRPMRLGERIRVAVGPACCDTIVGTALEVRNDTLRVRVHADSTARVSLRDVVVLDASAGLRDRSGLQNGGAVLGGVLGTAAGIVIGVWASPPAEDEFGRLNRAVGGALGGVIGMAGGAILGHFAASDVERERWVPVTPPSLGVAVVSPPAPDSATAAREVAEWRATTLTAGTRIRVQRVSDAPDVTGSVIVPGDTLRIRRDDGREVAVPWTDVLRVSVSRGMPPALRSVGLPALAGAAAGALTGARVIGLVNASCSLRPDCRDDALAIGGGAVLGALIGLAYGEAQREEQWTTVWAPGRTR